jgi:hypothetical protein
LVNILLTMVSPLNAFEIRRAKDSFVSQATSPCAARLSPLTERSFPQDVFTAQSLVTGARKVYCSGL